MEKFRMYVISGGWQDLTNLHLPRIDDISEIIKNDIEGIIDSDAKKCEYTIKIKLMTQKQIDNLPEYEF